MQFDYIILHINLVLFRIKPHEQQCEMSDKRTYSLYDGSNQKEPEIHLANGNETDIALINVRNGVGERWNDVDE